MSYQLQSNTFSGLFIGQNLITLKRVSSTNDYLKDRLSNSTPLPEGTVIMADEQFAGRGQMGNNWHSEAGKNLMVSIILKPGFLSPLDQFWLNMAISSGLCQTLKSITSEKIKIKWPNDIYHNNNKIGAILIENILQANKIKYSIIGIGVNVNQVNFPQKLSKAISLKQILHEGYPKEKLLYEICQSIEQRYLQLKAGKWDNLKDYYLRNLFSKGVKQAFSIDGVKVEGIILDVLPSGRMLVDFGEHQSDFGFKEIEFII